MVNIKKVIATTLISVASLSISIKPDESTGFSLSFLNKAYACSFTGSGGHYTLTCPRPRGGNEVGYVWRFALENGGRGVWQQYDDWAADTARNDYQNAIADISYDVRTGFIDAKEACELHALTNKNYCRSGHRNAALIVGGACILTGTVVTGTTATAAAIALCGTAVAAKLDKELDLCELEYSYSKARCD